MEEQGGSSGSDGGCFSPRPALVACLRNLARRFWNQTCGSCFSRGKGNLDTRLGEVDATAELLSDEHVRVLCLPECLLQSLDLLVVEGCPLATLGDSGRGLVETVSARLQGVGAALEAAASTALLRRRRRQRGRAAREKHRLVP